MFKSQAKANFSLLKVLTKEKDYELAAKWGKKGARVTGMRVDSLNQKITVSHVSRVILLFLSSAEDSGLLAMQVK